jgi:hypothetical protein
MANAVERFVVTPVRIATTDKSAHACLLRNQESRR